MALAATLNIKLKLSESGSPDKVYGVDSEGNIKDRTLTVPVEYDGKRTIVSTAQTTALQLSSLAPHIALAKATYLYIEAVSGTIYLQIDTAGTTTFAEAAAHIVIQSGDANLISINPAGNLGVAIDASAVTDSFEWLLLGKA